MSDPDNSGSGDGFDFLAAIIIVCISVGVYGNNKVNIDELDYATLHCNGNGGVVAIRASSLFHGTRAECGNHAVFTRPRLTPTP